MSMNASGYAAESARDARANPGYERESSFLP
jgi:hypothetical protein